MSKRSIALFANHGSKQLGALHDELIALGAETHVFDIQLAGNSRSGLGMRSDRLAWDGVDFSPIHAVHIRCTAPKTFPVLPPVLNAASYNDLRGDYLREQECVAATYTFFERLKDQGKLVINPLTTAYLDHNAKGQLYCKLRAEGFPAPRTLVTNDRQAAAAFIEEVGEAVVKPAIGVGSTRLIHDEDRERLHELALCPVLMQQRLRGHTVRVHIVGDTVVLALEIITDGQIDSRTETQRFDYLKLPEAVEDAVVRANRMLGLHYSAWDIIGEGDSYYFLDCNPGPYIMWIGPQFVHTVFENLGRYMITFCNTGSVEQASASVQAWQPH